MRRAVSDLLRAAPRARHARARLIDSRVNTTREVLRLAGNAAQVCLRDSSLNILVVDRRPLAVLTRDVRAGPTSLHSSDRVAR